MSNQFILDEYLRQNIRYEADVGILSGIDGSLLGWVNREGYLQVSIKGRILQAHRIAWFLVKGVWPIAEIDHVDGDRVNNRISNLREVSHRSNMQNQRCHRNGHLAGTTKHKNKYQSRIYLDGKLICLGTYPTREEAHCVYMAKLNAITSGVKV